jgi:hypothetical protein
MAFHPARAAARIGGNFGVSFFGPLVAGNVAESLYHIGLQFEQTLTIALIASLFQTGLAVSKEVQSYGEKRN